MVRISVFGMGYVGCVSAACLARDGHPVVGVDVSEIKLAAIRAGHSPLGEPGLEEIIHAAVESGTLRVTTDVREAVLSTDLSLICVGTPSLPTGGLDLSYVERVCEQIGAVLPEKEPGHVVCVRSTMLPGSLSNVVRPTLERTSGRKDGEHFHVAMNPEFLREGSAIQDFDNPPKIVLGTRSARAEALLREIYARYTQPPLFVPPPEVAEMVKYADNCWHAIKITFGNEIGVICRQAGVDSHRVMEIFVADRQLNISPGYLKPGFAFGGSCLPKDLKALTHWARHQDLDVPLLQSANVSNGVQIAGVAQRILDTGARRIGWYGLSFKPNTDDLRESPHVRCIESLLGRGVKIRILDDFIQLDRLTGANKEFIDHRIPHLKGLLVTSFEELEREADLLVIGHRTPAVVAWAAQRTPGVPVLDLARVEGLMGQPGYQGISW